MNTTLRTITVLAGLSLLLVACASAPAAAPAAAATPTMAVAVTEAPTEVPGATAATEAATEVPTEAATEVPTEAATATKEAPQVAAAATVTIDNFAFSPQSLQVKVGTTVTWTNNQGTTHTVTSDTGEWDSGNLSQGKSFSFTFTKAGTFAYHCAIHSSMTGTVEVTP
jgi:plastocyanin